jgi:hypothetical protein
MKPVVSRHLVLKVRAKEPVEFPKVILVQVHMLVELFWCPV